MTTEPNYTSMMDEEPYVENFGSFSEFKAAWLGWYEAEILRLNRDHNKRQLFWHS